MIRQLVDIAGNTFIEAVRQPVYFVMLMAGWLLQVLNVGLSGYSMGLTDSAEVTKDDKMLLDVGLATVFVASTVLAALICTSVVSREIENKTALTVISKPIGRPVFVIGKYLGATGAVLLAGVVLTLFFLMALRHGVMSTARDRVDYVVIAFGLGAVAVSVGVGAWCNFFYGWVFSSTTVFTMAPLVFLAWLGTLVVSPEWAVQPLSTDWLPQVMITALSVLLSLPVLSGVALAASTRLGQVMTIVVASGVFLAGMLSNHFFGRRAINNEPVARIEMVEAQQDRDGDFSDAGDRWLLTLTESPAEAFGIGASVYYGPAPSGYGLVTPPHAPFEGDPEDDNALLDAEDGALAVRSIGGEKLREVVVVNAGGLRQSRAPAPGDSLFMYPTEYLAAPMVLWGVIPNMQFFWLVDAVTQAHPIPPRYLGMMTVYALLQVVALNGIAVALFQRREVG